MLKILERTRSDLDTRYFKCIIGCHNAMDYLKLIIPPLIVLKLWFNVQFKVALTNLMQCSTIFGRNHVILNNVLLLVMWKKWHALREKKHFYVYVLMLVGRLELD